MHQNAGFCIINISSEGLNHQTPVAGGDTPTTPTPVPRRPILVPSASFRLATALCMGLECSVGVCQNIFVLPLRPGYNMHTHFALF